MNSTRPKLFLIDAMYLVYRSYYAFSKKPPTTGSGLNTSAMLGFTNTIWDLLQKQRPTHFAVAFDSMEPTERHETFLDYKANREATPEDIITSIPYIYSICDAMNIPVLVSEGYEADDIIGTLARQAEAEGFNVFIFTADKDLGQCTSDHIFIYRPGRAGNPDEILGPEQVTARFGIKRVDQVADMLGLWGDASDNIPGIPGVGEVMAKKLLAEFDTVENLIQNYTKILNPKLREKVGQYADQALLSKQLATILYDVPVTFHEEMFRVSKPDKKKLTPLFAELEFRNLAKRILDANDNETLAEKTARQEMHAEPEVAEVPEEKIKQTIHDVKHNYFLVQTAEERKALIQKLSEVHEFCFDTETTGLDPHHCEIVGISFSIKPQEAYYIPLPDNYDEACTILSEFKSLFANENISKIGQNLKFDISVLRWYDVSVKGFLFDTMLAHYLIEPESRHNMDFLSNTYLDYSPVPITKLIGEKGKNQQSMRMVDLEEVKEYTCEDADVTLQLKQVFEPILKDNNADILFNTVETPLVPVLSAMEAEGVRIDPIVLNEFSAQMQIELVQLEQEIHSLAGKTFNVASPKQLGEVLFDHLKIDAKAKKTKTQQYSTGEEILAKLLNKHPIIKKILDFRSLTKLRSTYIDPLPLLINPRTGRVHTSFNQAVTSTGRLSSNNPNLQNIPIRTERGREIRKAFVPRNDKYVLMSADYSQIELRIIASMSGDEAMIADFKAGLDIHTATAAKVYHVALTDVTRDMRRNAKMVNFGIIYGISAFGLAERLGIARSESKNIIEEYFKQYPAIKLFMDSTIIKAREDGFVETILGRRRYLRDIHSANSIVRNFAERNAINAPIQGSAADMIKVAMINIYNALEKKKLRSRLILQVHDELILDVLREETEEVDQIVREGMINAIPLNVPVEVELSTGANWLEAH